MDELSYQIPGAETYLSRIPPHLLANGLITDAPTKSLVEWKEEYLKKNLDSQIWWLQSMVHHVHSDYWEEDATCLEMEIAQTELWRNHFEELFPEHRFVIECETLDFVTWYQAFPDAPTKDDELWDLQGDWNIRFPSLAELQDSLTDFDRFSSLPQTIQTSNTEPSDRTEQDQTRLRDWINSLSIPEIDHRHRGAMFATALSTGNAVLFAAKNIRTVVGPSITPEDSDLRLLRDLKFD